MATSQSPPILGDYFTKEIVNFKPKIPEIKWLRHRLITKLRLNCAKMYWSERQPIEYLKSLCSAIVSQLEGKTLLLRMNDTIEAPQTCDQFTESVRSTVRSCFGPPSYISRYLSRTPKVYNTLEWTEGIDPTEQIFTHVVFIWAALSAVQEMQGEIDSITADNKAAILGCVSCWTVYLESIAHILLRKES